MTDPKQPKFYNLVGHGGEVVPDMLCCEGCGYGVCSCPAEPPDDELPEGWTDAPMAGFERYIHTSGARVRREPGSTLWQYWAPLESLSDASKPTRDEAMAAALASVQPEPTLRAGWEIRGKFMGQPDYWFGDFNVCSADGDSGDWSICDRNGFEMGQRYSLEAAMQRAEALGRGEP